MRKCSQYWLTAVSSLRKPRLRYSMTLVSPFMPPYSLPCSLAGAEASGRDSLIRSLEFHQTTGARARRRAGMAALRWRGLAEGALHDRADGPGAAPAFRAAAQTRIDLG